MLQADNPPSAIQGLVACSGLARSYHSDKIAECGNGQKCLFRMTKNLMGNKREIILLICSSDDNMAKKFSDFFTIQTAEIRDTIKADNSSLSETIGMRDKCSFLYFVFFIY